MITFTLLKTGLELKNLFSEFTALDDDCMYKIKFKTDDPEWVKVILTQLEKRSKES